MSEDLDFNHETVMLDEVVELFRSVPAGVIVDATVGGAGHTTAILESRADISVVAIDQDTEAVDAARSRLERFGDRAKVVHARFDAIASVVAEEVGGVEAVVGFIFDLGMSSPQLDNPERGMSFWERGPLDMRQDRTRTRTAADLVNDASEEDVAEVLWAYGDERFARRIAKAIVAARPVLDTLQLAELIRDAIPAATRRTGGHPARRSFQAVRMWTNEDLPVLVAGLDAAMAATAAGGRVVVISFHSGEDRIVKNRFKLAETGGCTCPSGLDCVCGAVPEARLLKRGGWVPTQDEIRANPRASSARLRAVEILPRHVNEELT